MNLLGSVRKNKIATPEECEYISENILEFSTYVLFDEYKANWSSWLCNTIEYLIRTYPDKIKYYVPYLHRLALKVGKITIQSELFSFFLGFYFIHSDAHLEFLAFDLCCNEQIKHKYIVSRMKRVEILWDIIDHTLENSKNDHYYKYIQEIYPLTGDVDITWDNLCREICLETEKFHDEDEIKIEFHDKLIDLYEYNMFRLMHLNESFLDIMSESNFCLIINQIKNNKHDIKMLIREIRPLLHINKKVIKAILKYTK